MLPVPMASETSLEIAELPPDAKTLVAECELTGRRTKFQRGERTVAILISYDEYLALRETISIAGDAELMARIAAADAETQRNAVLLPEELFGQ
jgi:hypothetical protein